MRNYLASVILIFVLVMVTVRVVCAIKASRYEKKVKCLGVGMTLQQVIFIMGVPLHSNYISSESYECVYETTQRKGAFFGKNQTLSFKLVFKSDGNLLNVEKSVIAKSK